MAISDLPDAFLLNEAKSHGAPTLLLAHGAGAPMDSEFMNQLALALCARGVSIVRFEFPYMAQRRKGGAKRPPPKADTLIEFFKEHLRIVSAAVGGPIYIGGKSMGARIASMLVSQLAANDDLFGCLLGGLGFGFPFHAPGKPAGKRVDHLQSVSKPVHIIQGTRDPFGKPAEVGLYPVAPCVSCAWLDTADHDFKPLKASGHTQLDMIERAAVLAAEFMVNHNHLLPKTHKGNIA